MKSEPMNNEPINPEPNIRNEKFLLNNETYQLLLNAQSRIRTETELVPKLRKIINTLLNEETIDRYVNEFIEKHKE